MAVLPDSKLGVRQQQTHATSQKIGPSQGFPTNILGIEKGKKEKKERFVSNSSNVTNFKMYCNNFSLVSYIFASYLLHDTLPYAQQPHVLQGTVHGSGHFRMSLLLGHSTSRQLGCRQEQRVTRLHWASGTIQRCLLPSRTSVLRYLAWWLIQMR